MRTIGIIVVAPLGLASPAAGQVPDPLSSGAKALEKADYPEARKWYGIAADQGDPIAQASLGHIYERGLGVVRTTPKRCIGTS